MPLQQPLAQDVASQTHDESTQRCPAPHATAHLPQLAESVAVLTQVPEQEVVGEGQEQDDPEHVIPPAHDDVETS